MSTFAEPDGVQGWESDEKVFSDKVWAQKCGKNGLFSKARVRVSFQGVISMKQMVSKVGKMMNKVFWDKVWAPKCGKSELFSKARVTVRVRVSLARCQNVHFR